LITLLQKSPLTLDEVMILYEMIWAL